MSYNAGFRRLLIESNDDTFPALVFYPTTDPKSSVAIGPYTLDVASDASVAEGAYPLIVVSHGGGSSPLVLRTYGIALAQRGFIVALPEHPGNNRLDNTRENSIRNLQDRPLHISRTIDTISGDDHLRSHLQSEKVGMIGHSMGGYTALALAGALPWWGYGHPVEVSTDKRISSLVLLAPASIWFVGNDTLNVHIPILAYGAEYDTTTPPWQTQFLRDTLPDPSLLEVHMIANATHYSFLSPFPAHLAGPGFPPSVDRPGFDRAVLHARLYEEIAQFFRTTLTA